MLFETLPLFPASLPVEELALLAKLRGCEWPTSREVDWGDHTAARRLESRGLIKISRQKDGPDASWPTWYAGKLPSSEIRMIPLPIEHLNAAGTAVGSGTVKC